MAFTDYTIKKLTKSDKVYPKGLLELSDSPKQLFYRGEWEKELNNTLAIVGSRRMTQYGRAVIDKFMPDFVAAGVTIVSGFMYGIDTYAHETAVKLGGKTIAVLAYGLDICYPAENDKLYEQILETKGIIMSEYEAKSKPQLWKFPKRNRIVAALSSLGVLVIEAGEESGSLITADIARKLKKQVYAVPGPITSNSSTGTNKLILDNKAIILTSSIQILGKEYKTKINKQNKTENSLEEEIVKILSLESLSLDELSAVLGLEITQLSTQVTLLALKGRVSEVNGKIYLTI